MPFTVRIPGKNRSKYNVAQKGDDRYHERFFQGKLYGSAAEANYARQCDSERRAGRIKGWRTQVDLPLIVNGEHVANYRVDFERILPDFSIEYVEIKGMETDIWKLKRKILDAMHRNDPRFKLTVLRKGKKI